MLTGLMGVSIDASLKFLIVFTGATLFSWLTAQCLMELPGFAGCFKQTSMTPHILQQCSLQQVSDYRRSADFLCHSDV